MTEKQRPVLTNSVLGYCYVRLKDSTPEETKKSLMETFDAHEFADAKEALWSHLERENSDYSQTIGKKPRRRINSDLRTSTEADCDDVIQAVSMLDHTGKLPNLAVSVEDLMSLPPITPQLISYKRKTSNEENKEETLVSHEPTEKALSSLREAQERMASELSELRKKLEEPHPKRVDVIDVRAQRSQVHQVSPPVAKEVVAHHQTYSSATELQERPFEHQRIRRSNRRKAKVITGTEECGDQEGFLGAPAVSNLFVFRVKKNVSTDDVSKWLKEERRVHVVAMRKRSHPDAPTNSFKVTILKDVAKELLKPEFRWPINTKVRRFTPSRAGSVEIYN